MPVIFLEIQPTKLTKEVSVDTFEDLHITEDQWKSMSEEDRKRELQNFIDRQYYPK